MISNRKLTAALAAVAVLALGACQSDQSADPTGPDVQAMAAPGAGGGNGGGGGAGGPGGPGGGGGGDTGFGNNLSYPVVLANGIGLAGGAVAGIADFANTGFRPVSTVDAGAYAALSASPAVPFWYAGNISEAYTGTTGVFWQKTANVWQAEWATRPGTTATPVVVDWGDNLRSVKFATTSVIRVEHILQANDGTSLLGFPMDIAVNPSSPSEQQGIYDDGNQTQTVAFTPTVFTDRARLKLQKLDAQGGNVTFTYFDKAVFESFGIDGPGAYSAEINVGGKVLFGYVWDLKKVVMPGGISKDGWWRITFSLDNGSGTTFTGLALGDEVLATYTPTVTTAEIQIGTKRGGGRKP